MGTASSTPPRRQERLRVAPDTPLADMPATVVDYSANGRRVAAVTHPAGPQHANALATIERLRARGYTIVAVRSC